MNYVIVVDFDDKTSDAAAQKTYFSMLDKYGARGIGDEDGKSRIFVHSEKPLNLEELAKDLSGIKIRYFHED
jgi:hypothetical protein